MLKWLLGDDLQSEGVRANCGERVMTAENEASLGLRVLKLDAREELLIRSFLKVAEADVDYEFVFLLQVKAEDVGTFHLLHDDEGPLLHFLNLIRHCVTGVAALS